MSAGAFAKITTTPIETDRDRLTRFVREAVADDHTDYSYGGPNIFQLIALGRRLRLLNNLLNTRRNLRELHTQIVASAGAWADDLPTVDTVSAAIKDIEQRSLRAAEAVRRLIDGDVPDPEALLDSSHETELRREEARH